MQTIYRSSNDHHAEQVGERVQPRQGGGVTVQGVFHVHYAKTNGRHDSKNRQVTATGEGANYAAAKNDLVATVLSRLEAEPQRS